MSLIQCKECGHEMSTKAKNCPQCGAVAAYRWGIGRIIMAIIILFFVLAIFLPMITDKKNVIDINGADSMDAYIAATNFVRAKLANPHTAKFYAHIGSDIKKLSNDTCSVASYVDSKNDFGGEVRIYFTVKMKHLSNKKWKLLDLRMNRE